MRRVVITCARETGQKVEEIANTSWALTLWTYHELLAMKEEESIRRMGERTDMAGLIAIAFHQPNDLQKMEMRYLKAAGKLSNMMDDARGRLEKLMQAHQHVQPVMRGGPDD